MGDLANIAMEIDQSFQDGDQSSFHFLEEDGIVIKGWLDTPIVFRASFSSFTGHFWRFSFACHHQPSILGACQKSVRCKYLSDFGSIHFQICNNGVESIRKLSTGIRKGNPMSQDILTQLCEERNAYLLIWSLFEAESSAKNTRQVFEPNCARWFQFSGRGRFTVAELACRRCWVSQTSCELCYQAY